MRDAVLANARKSSRFRLELERIMTCSGAAASPGTTHKKKYAKARATRKDKENIKQLCGDRNSWEAKTSDKFRLLEKFVMIFAEFDPIGGDRNVALFQLGKHLHKEIRRSQSFGS